MIKSIFFRALTLLGLTFVLIGCGAAEPADAGGTGTPGAAGVSMEDVTKEVEKLIRDSKGKVDLADGQAVATKIVSIMKASQPIGSCSLFAPGVIFGLSNTATELGTASAAAQPKPLKPYIAKGDVYPGGSGTLTVSSTGYATATTGVRAATDILTAVGAVEYKYDKYSIDGIYFLNGTLKFTNAAGVTVALPGISALASVASTLTLSEGGVEGTPAKDIAKFTTAPTFAPTFAADADKNCGGQPFLAAAMASAITVKKADDGDFTPPVVLAVGAVSLAAGGVTPTAASANANLLMALIGPRNS